MEKTIDQEYACRDCDFTSPIPNEVCPSCSGRMVALDAPMPVKKKESSDSDDELLSDEEIAADEEGTELSLEKLKEEESEEDDEPFMNEDDPESY